MERGGIIESLTKVFVRILKDRPEDPTQYLLQSLGDARLQADNIEYLQNELEDARSEIQRLTDIIRGINPELLNESNDEVSRRDVDSAQDSVNTNDAQDNNHSNSSQTNFMQREEYTPIGGVDDGPAPEANVAQSGNINE